MFDEFSCFCHDAFINVAFTLAFRFLGRAKLFGADVRRPDAGLLNLTLTFLTSLTF